MVISLMFLKMRNSDKLFFNILRKGLWDRSETDIDYSADLRVWRDVLGLSFSQTVVGIIADGLSTCPQGVVPSEVSMRLISASVSTAQRNEQMNVMISQLIPTFEKFDLPVVIVKGQAIAQCYKNPFSRTPGDIDLVVKPEDYERTKVVIKELSRDEGTDDSCVKHFAATVGNIEVEVHGTIHTSLSKRINDTLDEIQAELLADGGSCLWNCYGANVSVPSANFDVLYIFLHLLQHFFCGGLGLRQLCDMAMSLHVHNDDIDKQKLIWHLERMGLVSEWKAFVAFLVNYLSLLEQEAPLYDSKYINQADRIWEYVRKTGNFGKNKSRRYGINSSYLLRKAESLIRNASCFINHIRLFPSDSIKFFGYYFVQGINTAIKGE